MGDFYLDFRAAGFRRCFVERACTQLRFCEDTQVRQKETESFSLVLSRVDGFDLWGPAELRTESGDVFVALAGRIAIDEQDWNTAERSGKPGGVACRFILDRYLNLGLDGLESLNGNFVVFIHDGRSGEFHIFTDRFGMMLAYSGSPVSTSKVFASHPDVVASGLELDRQFDFVSLAEFVTTGRLSFPRTYFKSVIGIEPGSVTTVNVDKPGGPHPTRQYFDQSFEVDEGSTIEALADDLAAAFKRAVSRRSLDRFGRTGVGLSGGLDSRAVLSAVEDPSNIVCFTLVDKENEELQTARRLAAAFGSRIETIRRDDEYYAESAEQGVRISGGTGSIASNHFLGVRRTLRDLGIRNVLTGCYCDYLFKALALNTIETRFLREQRRTSFDFAYYHSFHWEGTKFGAEVKDRLTRLFPESDSAELSDDEWLNVERKRSYPLAYEGDLAQRVIPQRVMPWYVPMADNELMEVYRRIPSRFKLNGALFKKMVLRLCDESVLSISDNNTGAPVNATGLGFAFHRYYSALRNRIKEKIKPGMATRGSWPNWRYYLNHSRLMPSLWERSNAEASEVFQELIGHDPISQSPARYVDIGVEYFFRLFTLKLWLDQRFKVATESFDAYGSDGHYRQLEHTGTVA